MRGTLGRSPAERASAGVGSLAACNAAVDSHLDHVVSILTVCCGLSFAFWVGRCGVHPWRLRPFHRCSVPQVVVVVAVPSPVRVRLPQHYLTGKMLRQREAKPGIRDFWVTTHLSSMRARKELGPLHASLYDLEAHEDEFIDSRLRHARGIRVRACRCCGRGRCRIFVASLLLPTEAVPGVYKLPMFTPKFCQLLLEEYRHHDASGIPLRRPNGMNRFGAILDELGLEPSLRFLSRRYLRPLGQLLYPWLIAEGDADEHYGFLVRYKPGEDVSLAEHADASVLTLNANLCGGFTGGSLAFRGTRWVDAKPQQVPQSFLHFSSFQPGEAILHLGGHHSALPIESGERANLIVWLFGKHGVVRFMAH